MCFSWKKGCKACNFWVLIFCSLIFTAEHISIQCKVWKKKPTLCPAGFIACARNIRCSIFTTQHNSQTHKLGKRKKIHNFILQAYVLTKKKPQKNRASTFCVYSESQVLSVNYTTLIRRDGLAAAEVFSVASLSDGFPWGFAGKIYSGKCQRFPLLQNLCSDEDVFPYLGSIHVPAA